MPKFFKREEKRPFTYPTIQEHRESTDYTLWIIGGVILIVTTLIVFLIFK